MNYSSALLPYALASSSNVSIPSCGVTPRRGATFSCLGHCYTQNRRGTEAWSAFTEGVDIHRLITLGGHCASCSLHSSSSVTEPPEERLFMAFVHYSPLS